MLHLPVLIVEDNYLNQKLYRDVFQIHGIDCAVCRNAEQGLKWLSINPDTQIALVDIGLPGTMNGLEFIRYLRRMDEWQDIKIIAATAYSSTEDKKRIISAGANYFMPKPLNIKKLVELVKYLQNPPEDKPVMPYLASAEGETYDW